MKFTALFLTLSLVLAACTDQLGASPTSVPDAPPSAENTPAPDSTPATGDESSDENSLLGTQWVLESFGTPGAESAVVGETPLTLDFSLDGQVGGYGGCNSFGGSYTVEGDTLVLGEIVSTLVACVDTAQMNQEVEYLNALQSVTQFQVDGDHLAITYNEGQGVLSFVSAVTSPTEEEATPTATPEPEAAAPSTPATEAVAGSPTGDSQNFIWNCYFCGGNQVWSFDNGEASRLDLPVEISGFFGYAPATGRVLYSTPKPVMGGGPSQITVGDLWMLDVATGEAEPLISEQTVVEAEWAPDGEHFVYVLATDTTYELHWRVLDGADTLLASDVAFTFSVSPNGDQVAFTRESNYGLPGLPGFYVVDVATAAETMLTDTDRAGAGGIEDKPVWSPAGQSVLLPTYGTTASPGLIRAAADGSNSVALGFDSSLANEAWYEAEPFSPFWITETQFIASASLDGSNAQMGGDTSLILYQLNESLDTIVDGAVIKQGNLLGWDVPGASIWVQTEVGEMESIPLPTL